MKARDRYEARARAWETGGRPPEQLLEGWSLIALRCWSFGPGAEVDGMSEALRAFVRASNDAQREDWLDDYLGERETCRACGQSYRLENLSLCTHCSRTLCPSCAGQRDREPNGNPACACGEGELVG